MVMRRPNKVCWSAVGLHLRDQLGADRGFRIGVVTHDAAPSVEEAARSISNRRADSTA
jgi:hypothetical protein